jgi:two-component system NarL family sensor kinase
MEKWQDPRVIAFWIAIIVVLIVTIILFVVRIMHVGYKRMTEANLREAQLKLEHQQKLMETNLIAQENERQRIAADLHDGLIGKLTVIRMKSQIGAEAAEVENLLQDSITEARRISHDLTPPLLEHSPLADLIENLLDPWHQKMDIAYQTDIRTTDALSPQQKLQMLRVVQELLTNIIKHAQAEKVTVHLRQSPNMLCLYVTDNGKGFDTAQLAKGLGLNSMELRMQYLNAKHKVKSASGKGTRTIVAAKTA